jgi:hypothetical protein
VASRFADFQVAAATRFAIEKSGHLISAGTIPTAAAGAGAGTAPPAPVVTAGATDTRGNVTFGTGTAPAAGAQVVVTFASAFASAPLVVVTPTTALTVPLNLYVASTTSNFTVNAQTAPAASQGNTVYGFNYFLMQ